MCQAEPSEIESESPESQSVDSIYETAPELKSETLEEEHPLPPEFKVLSRISVKISATPQDTSVRGDHRFPSLLRIP